MANKKKKKTAQKQGAQRPAKKAAGKKPAGKKPSPKSAARPASKGKSAKSQAKSQPKAQAKGQPKAQAKSQPKKAKPAPKAQKAAKAPAAPAAPRNAKVKFAVPRAPKSTIRTPEGAEELKQKLGALSSAVNQVKSLKRTLNKSFYEIGQILREIRDERLYEVKGYGSFEAFVEREIDLGKQTSLRIVQIVQTFLKDAALKFGLERLTAALEALETDGEAEPTTQQSTTASGTRSAIPIHKQ